MTMTSFLFVVAVYVALLCAIRHVFHRRKSVHIMTTEEFHEYETWVRQERRKGVLKERDRKSLKEKWDAKFHWITRGKFIKPKGIEP